MSRGQLKEALLVAQAACEGNMQTLHVSTPKGSSYSDDIYKEDFNELLHTVSKELAEWYFQDGRAVLAACCHLAVDDIEVPRFTSVSVNEKLLRCIMVFEGRKHGDFLCKIWFYMFSKPE